MSDFVVIHKQILKDLAQHAPDKDSLLRVIEEEYDPDPKNKYKFLVMPSNTAEHPAAYAVDESIDWALIHTVGNFIEQLCPHLPEEEQTRLVDRLHNKLSGKFARTVQTLGSALAAIVPNARKVIEEENADDKQATGFAPESVEPLVESLWKHCEKIMGKIVEEDEKGKNSAS